MEVNNRNDRILLEMCKIFKMKQICEHAGVNYQVFKNWKHGSYLSEEKKEKIIQTAIELLNDIRDYC